MWDHALRSNTPNVESFATALPRKAAQVVAQEFESRVKQLLVDLGFREVDGGPSFSLGGHQIDVVGAAEDAVVVVECVTSANQVNLRDQITNLRGKIPDIENDLKKIERYKRFKSVRFALAVKSKVPPNDNSLQYAKTVPNIHLWDEGFIQYYSDLRRTIHQYSLYNLLGELDVAPRTKSVLEIPAFRFVAGNLTAFQFIIDPQKILPYCYVARREVGNEQYYQRIVQSSRLGHIKEYIESDGVFPTNIVLSVEKADFVELPEVREKSPEWPEFLHFGLLSFPLKYRSCWIIDGQHRLYAFADANRSTPVSVWAFKGLDLVTQTKFFLDINNEAKPVDPDLLWDLLGTTGVGILATISRTVKALNTKPPLQGRIYIPLEGPKERRRLKMAGLCTAIKKTGLCADYSAHPVTAGNPLYVEGNDKKTVDHVSDALSVFFNGLEMVCTELQKGKFIFTNGGMAVMTSIFERIVVAVNRVPTDNDVRPYVNAINDHLTVNHSTPDELTHLKRLCASEGGREEVTKELLMAIKDKVTNSKFAPDLETLPILSRIATIERSWATTIAKVLSKVQKNWFEARVPDTIRETVLGRRRNDLATPVEDFFTLGECQQITVQEGNWKYLEKWFTEVSNGFASREELTVAYRKIIEMRAKPSHGRKPRLTPSDRLIAEAYVAKFESCFQYLKESASAT